MLFEWGNNLISFLIGVSMFDCFASKSQSLRLKVLLWIIMDMQLNVRLLFKCRQNNEDKKVCVFKCFSLSKKIHTVIIVIFNFNSKSNWLKIYTTLGYIVSLILLNLGHVFRFRIVSRMCSADMYIFNYKMFH